MAAGVSSNRSGGRRQHATPPCTRPAGGGPGACGVGGGTKAAQRGGGDGCGCCCCWTCRSGTGADCAGRAAQAVRRLRRAERAEAVPQLSLRALLAGPPRQLPAVARVSWSVSFIRYKWDGTLYIIPSLEHPLAISGLACWEAYPLTSSPAATQPQIPAITRQGCPSAGNCAWSAWLVPQSTQGCLVLREGAAGSHSARTPVGSVFWRHLL